MKRKSDTFVNGNEINLEFLKQKLESEKVLKTKLEQQLSEVRSSSIHMLSLRGTSISNIPYISEIVHNPVLPRTRRTGPGAPTADTAAFKFRYHHR